MTKSSFREDFILTFVSTGEKPSVRRYVESSTNEIDALPVGLCVRACVRLRFPYRIVLFQVLGRIFLGVASDLSDQDDALGLGVLQENLQAVDEVCSVEGIATDALQKTKQRQKRKIISETGQHSVWLTEH